MMSHTVTTRLSSTVVIISLLLNHCLPTHSFLLYGCNLSDNLCEKNEYCFPDGVFGQCYSEDSGTPLPTVLSNLDETQLQLLKLELTRLASKDQEWNDAQTQCVLAYFKLSMYYNLMYDSDFCQVQNPSNIWALVQLIDVGLNQDPSVLSNADTVNDQLLEVPETTEEDVVEDAQPVLVSDDDVEVPAETMEDILEQLKTPLRPSTELVEESLNDDDSDELVNNYVQAVINNENPDFSELSDEQLSSLLLKLVELRENMNTTEQVPVATEVGEEELAVPLDALSDEPEVLKKDVEQVGEVDQGLDNTEHRIVKGRRAVTRVAADRVYLKISNDIKTEEQLKPLLEFLQNTIALPNNLFFDDFNFDNGQLSMRISRFQGSKPKNEKRIDNVEDVAQAVYKRRKDIAKLSGAEVKETGIGSGDETLRVESTERDWMLLPVLFVSSFTVAALFIVAVVHIVKSRKQHYNDNIQCISDQLEGKNSVTYQDLCRQRADGGRGSKSSSTSSWSDETAPPTIDISTGHVVLNFLQEYLSEPTKIEAQWESIKDYANLTRSKNKAEAFPDQNRTIVPFDDNLVEVETENPEEKAYINASFIYDDDPRQAVYIAAQTPSADQIPSFWHAVWQNDVCLIVNLSTIEECKANKTYWPETGSQVHANFEIHLVSEHIWSDDYLVRSFYLKNLSNNQTRTITQFHYLSWHKNATPPSAKSLLEFRRKVNKSYKGRSSAVLVHSHDGAGRIGVYCAVDVLSARILRGVRQIDVVATIEHLRDQREGMVATGDQFKLIYGCVAQEVNHLLKSISQS